MPDLNSVYPTCSAGTAALAAATAWCMAPTGGMETHGMTQEGKHVGFVV